MIVVIHAHAHSSCSCSSFSVALEVGSDRAARVPFFVRPSAPYGCLKHLSDLAFLRLQLLPSSFPAPFPFWVNLFVQKRFNLLFAIKRGVTLPITNWAKWQEMVLNACFCKRRRRHQQQQQTIHPLSVSLGRGFSFSC